MLTDHSHSHTASRVGLSRVVARWHSWIAWWYRNTTLAVRLSLVALAVIVIPVLFANTFAPYQPTAIDLRNRLSPPGWAEGGTWDHPLGTDSTGRDILSRILYGGRVSLTIGCIASVIGLVIGTALGLISGYMRGLIDQGIMFLVDVQLSLPFILLAVAVALVLGNSLPVLVGIAALSTWPHYARVVRGVVLTLNDREFVVAARAVGAGHWHIMRAHMLPNLLSSMLVLGTLSLGRIILLESGLSFLGIGVRPPTPSWGNMISDGRAFLTNAPWWAVMPGIALVIVTMAVGTIGDWLRDVTDITTEH
jgi:peptide/nickel transport system permease protein